MRNSVISSNIDLNSLVIEKKKGILCLFVKANNILHPFVYIQVTRSYLQIRF
jgi:hypothetical protein